MKIHRYLVSSFLIVLSLNFTFGQKQGLVHPWMLFSNSDISAIKTKLALPANALIYKSLTAGSGLKYALYGDLADLAAVKTNCYNLVLTARSRMVSTDPWASFQWGRRMQELLIPISLVINNTSSPYSTAEIARLRLSCDSIAWRFRDSTYSEIGGGGTNNRTLDELMGVAFAGVFMFPDNPNATNHYAYVMNQLTKHLAYIGSDGTWPETTRYVGQVVIKCMLLFARVQKNYLGNNTGLISDPKLKSLIKGFMQIATPKDVLYGNLRDVPAIGDAGCGESNLSYLAWAAAEMASVDPVFSKQLMGIWKMSGGTYNVGTLSFQLAMADAQAPADTSFVLPSVIQKNIGYYIFRNNYGTSAESYLITHLPDRNFYHRHFDCGAFTLYSKNTPLMLDAGVGDYAEPDVSFYKSTVNHNVVSFKDINGLYVNGMDYGAVALDTLLSADYDFVSANISPAITVANKYIRSTGYLKTLFNTIILYDYVDSNSGMLHSNNLHTFSSSTDQQTCNGFLQTVSHAYNGLDIEMSHLLPTTGITFSKVLFKPGNYPTAWPHNLANLKDAGDMTNCYQECISVNNSGKNHYLTLIRPKEKTDVQSTITALTLNNSSCKGFKVTVPGKGSYIILINTSTMQQTTSVQFGVNSSAVSMRSKVKYSMDSAGKFTVNVPAMSMDVFMTNNVITENDAVSSFKIEIKSTSNKGIYEIVGDCEGANFSVVDLLGQTIMQSTKIFDSHHTIDLSKYPQGTYILRIVKEGKNEEKKIIVSR